MQKDQNLKQSVSLHKRWLKIAAAVSKILKHIYIFSQFTKRRGNCNTTNTIMENKGRRATHAEKKKKAASTPPPPPPPPTLPATRKPPRVKSFTRDEIDRYWRMRRMIEEDHLLFAQKAAARIRAKSLKEEDHRRFEELLKEMLEEEEEKEKEKTGGGGGNNKELRVGIKDWWTKSKYAYLNQPAIRSMGENEDNSTYIPQKTCFYLSPAMDHFCATSFGVH